MIIVVLLVSVFATGAKSQYSHAIGLSRVDDNGTRLIQHPAGREVRMRCAVRQGHVDLQQNSQVRWDFKPCGEAYNKTSCRDIIKELQEEMDDSEAWSPVDCGKPCRATLVIPNPTEADSGLYRCSIQPYRPDSHTVLNIQVARSYELEVISLVADAPLLLDGLPVNATTFQSNQVVLQCKVLSKVPPTILWLKQLDNEAPPPSGRLVQFLNKTYQAINSSGDMSLTEDVYLSKLILPSATEKDSGFYVCVGLNYQGFSKQGAHVHIIGGNLEHPGTTDTSMYYLFLIPVALAVVPLTVWLCYTYKKKKSSDEPISDENRPRNRNCVNKSKQILNSYNVKQHNKTQECRYKPVLVV